MAGVSGAAVYNVVLENTYPRCSEALKDELMEIAPNSSVDRMRLLQRDTVPGTQFAAFYETLCKAVAKKGPRNDVIRDEMLDKIRALKLYSNYRFKPIKLVHLFRGHLSHNLKANANIGLNLCLAYAINHFLGQVLLETVGDFFDFMKNTRPSESLPRFLKSFFDRKALLRQPEYTLVDYAKH